MNPDEDDLTEDPENPDPSDMDKDDYVITVRCPGCKKFIDEEAEQCPRCGIYITAEEAPAERRFPWWVSIGIVLALVGILYAWVFRG